MGGCDVRCAGAFLLLVAGLALAQAAQPPQPPQSRDDLWRMIFARPASPPAGVPAERAALGFDLFHDVRLSGNGARSCASCHDPAKGFSNGAARGEGLDGQPLPRNVLGLFNLAWGKAFYWDGRAPALEAQARFPILAANEMAGDFATIIARLESDAATRDKFRRAFPERAGISRA